MSNLVLIKRQDNQEILVTTSEVISERVNYSHESVQRLIRNHIASLEVFGKVGFEIRASKKNQEEKIFFLNEQQSTLLVTFMRNNEKVINFKIDLVKQFYQMREMLRQKQTPEWQSIRKEGKANNSVLTDTIKKFIDYAFRQGSNHANMYYKHFEKLANDAIGIGDGQRSYTDTNLLSAQIFIFNVINKTLIEEMAKETHYKLVYPMVKEKVEGFRQLFLSNEQLMLTAKKTKIKAKAV